MYVGVYDSISCIYIIIMCTYKPIYASMHLCMHIYMFISMFVYMCACEPYDRMVAIYLGKHHLQSIDWWHKISYIPWAQPPNIWPQRRQSQTSTSNTQPFSTKASSILVINHDQLNHWLLSPSNHYLEILPARFQRSAPQLILVTFENLFGPKHCLESQWSS